jgi:hypothetical protein
MDYYYFRKKKKKKKRPSIKEEVLYPVRGKSKGVVLILIM